MKRLKVSKNLVKSNEKFSVIQANKILENFFKRNPGNEENRELFRDCRVKNWRELRRALLPMAIFLRTKVPPGPLHAESVMECIEVWEGFNAGKFDEIGVQGDWDNMLSMSASEENEDNIFHMMKYLMEWV